MSASQTASYHAKLDQFAELLSLNLETPEIAERMGITRPRASQMLGQLRKKYGWQAR